MAKQQIKKDVAKLNGFIDFYEFVSTPVGGGSYNDEWVLSLSTRCAHELKSKASQSVVNAGSWDFVQVETFIIRSRSGWNPEKDMIIYFQGSIYLIKGIAPLDTNPRYIQIYTETINDDSHELWTIINAMPIDSDKPNVIYDED